MRRAYLGDPTNPANQGEDIREDESTSVFVSNLPSDCLPTHVLMQLRGVGKIWASNFIPPQAPYTTAASKIVFWDRDGLDAFFAKWRHGDFIVSGHRPHVVMNWFRTSSKPPSDESRALTVTGPPEIVELFRLCEFLQAHFHFELEDMIEMPGAPDEGQTTIEVRFASWRAQASKAWSVVRKAIAGVEMPETPMTEREKYLWRSVTVDWAPDPSA
ncbi:Uu.00g084100.m01.CDS01 [Anthostomella pinea]|uniref:Uu.00g084100.m01.CDS01 n=1 Tax=Anthostomella pinea TaxID=933095 RepID=A0AAI8VLP3_9PEZI|nr:Uu.00g084100.m01.CDS01 [Anthostomella pinea]